MSIAIVMSMGIAIPVAIPIAVTALVVVVEILGSVVAVILTIFNRIEGEIVYDDAGYVGANLAQYVAGSN